MRELVGLFVDDAFLAAAIVVVVAAAAALALLGAGPRSSASCSRLRFPPRSWPG